MAHREDDPHKPLRDDVRLLGTLLGDTLRQQAGVELFEAVETVRGRAKDARTGDSRQLKTLARDLAETPMTLALPLARAFSHFLNLANIAEQHHRVRRRRAYLSDPSAAPQRASFQESFFLTSDNVRSWNEAKELRVPSNPWEIVQIGNCGAPIETEAGWLVLTHGVGAMRCYAIGALLLDLNDPQRIIGQLAEPLLVPGPDEREGYVPNVVYTCGGIVHEGRLILPYGFSDVGIAVATIPIDELVSRLRDGSMA